MPDHDESSHLARISLLEQAAVHQAAITHSLLNQLQAVVAVNTALVCGIRGLVDTEQVRGWALGAVSDAGDPNATAHVNAMMGRLPLEETQSAPAEPSEDPRARFRVIEGGPSK